MRVIHKPSSERKEEIVEVALELAAEQGIKNVTTQAIADRVGIAQPTIFRHFKTRDAIFLAAIEWIAGQLFKALEGFFTGDLPADERLRRLLNRQLNLLSGKRGISRVLFSDRLHSEAPELKAAVRSVMDRYARHVADLIREGAQTGRFRSDIDPEEAARLIMAMIQGLIMRWSIYEFDFPLEKQADSIWNFIWPALAPKDR